MRRLAIGYWAMRRKAGGAYWAFGAVELAEIGGFDTDKGRQMTYTHYPEKG